MKYYTKRHKISTDLDNEQVEALNNVGLIENRGLSDLIRLAINIYLLQFHFKSIPSSYFENKNLNYAMRILEKKD